MEMNFLTIQCFLPALQNSLARKMLASHYVFCSHSKNFFSHWATHSSVIWTEQLCRRECSFPRESMDILLPWWAVHKFLLLGNQHIRFFLHSHFSPWGMAIGYFLSKKIQVKSRWRSRKSSTCPRNNNVLELYVMLLSWSPLLGP